MPLRPGALDIHTRTLKIKSQRAVVYVSYRSSHEENMESMNDNVNIKVLFL